MANILHITPHFGGGVGTVLRALIDGIAKNSDHKQEVVSFEYLNEKTMRWVELNSIAAYSDVLSDSEWLQKRVCNADIVHIHFWNHPALYYFIYTISGQSARIVMWSHVNGHFAPYLFNDAVIDFPEIYVVSTKYSLSQKKLCCRSNKWKSKHLRTVHSTAGLNGFDKIEPMEHRGINVGYIGTVDYVKMHRDFINIFSEVQNQEANFIVCGGNSHEDVHREAEQIGIADRFDFLGQVEDVKSILTKIDIFAYPLNRENYGTGEQVLIEAMSAGIPQVVFADGPEEIVVEDGVTGFVCNNNLEFSKAIDHLCNDEKLRKIMGRNSKQRAKKYFNFDKSLKKWLSIYDELYLRDKNVSHFEVVQSGDIAVDLFLLSLGECKAQGIFEEIFQYYPNDIPVSLLKQAKELPSIFKSETRGSAKHYNSFFKSERLFTLSNQI
ncbi:glycosyltransferase family 4 protein [Desulfopila sp. IMCC35008]|uniref:glycosyltransferase family 4 protein n=1 Tax=Desulfopila sp. IMCC35008 TaxID=2653858 RepID=UPI0013D3CEA7|nr:glycosyltransferase family 4 protein [Desulfopila sp. IMCC35008]